MIQYVFIPKRRGRGRLSRACYSGRYKVLGMAKPITVPLVTTDERIAEEKLQAIVDELQREAAGIISPKPLREAAQRSMTVHLSEFIADLKALQRDSMYVYNADKHVAKLIKECGWKLPKDVTSDSFLTWRAKQNKAAKTLNGYLDFSNVLLNWMQRQGRLIANPLAGVGRVQTQGKEKRVRRAVTDEEMRRLIGVASLEHRLPYLLAVHTGLRRDELKRLEWGDIHLDAPVPFISARASTTKNKKVATLGLPPEVVEELRKLPQASASARVLKRVPSMEVYRKDLTAAGIDYKDAQGRQFDFHALRHQCGTMLGRLGVAPRVAMEVMRHSDIRLTYRTYTDVKQLPTLGVVEMLPRFLPLVKPATAATGTDGASQIAAQIVAQSGVCLGLGKSRSVTQTGTGGSEKTLCFVGESPSPPGKVAACHKVGESWGTRIRRYGG
jgi:integrase